MERGREREEENSRGFGLPVYAFPIPWFNYITEMNESHARAPRE
jgi:hypothetical protein